MTTLYRPVLIETADLPMDEFPEGTIAIHPDHWPVERCSCSRWESDGEDRYDPEMVGWTALVPVDAEEETDQVFTVRDPSVYAQLFGTPPRAPRTRLVTPWEEA